MEFEWLKNWNCFGIGEIKYLYLGWMVATQVTNIPFGLAFKENLKIEPHIGDMTILLSVIK